MATVLPRPTKTAPDGSPPTARRGATAEGPIGITQPPRHAAAAPPLTRPRPDQHRPAATQIVTLPANATAPRRSALARFMAHFSLVKCFTLFGFVVAAVHVIMYGLDLAIGWPLERASVAFDINNLVCGLALGFLSWSVFREQVRDSC